VGENVRFTLFGNEPGGNSSCGEAHREENIMRGVLAWMVEQACRLADDEVCAVANLTDDAELADA
jgi:hypothetical protein